MSRIFGTERAAAKASYRVTRLENVSEYFIRTVPTRPKYRQSSQVKYLNTWPDKLCIFPYCGPKGLYVLHKANMCTNIHVYVYVYQQPVHLGSFRCLVRIAVHSLGACAVPLCIHSSNGHSRHTSFYFILDPFSPFSRFSGIRFNDSSNCISVRENTFIEFVHKFMNFWGIFETVRTWVFSHHRFFIYFFIIL